MMVLTMVLSGSKKHYPDVEVILGLGSYFGIKE